jgi:hypothetical protein
MASYEITIPGNPGLEMQVGDTLTIHYRTAGKFCISSGNQNAFNPALPVGVAGQPNTPYTGTAISMTTIHYSSVNSNQNCGAPGLKDVGPGTIKVGTGK